MRLRKPLSILLSLSMIAGMSAFASNAAVTSDESVSAGNYYNANYLESYASKAYNESGLGSVYSKTSTTWKTWSPDASSVKLKLYTTGSDNEAGASAIGTYDMKKDSSTGVWSLNLSGDYKNKYYTYLVTVNGTTKETQDVYSQAVGVNGNRTMVVDLDSTDPSGWSDDKHVLFNSASEAAVWEVHVRDFSVSKSSGVSEDNKGKYLAFAEGGTTLNSDTSSSAVSTGIDYLVEQGINCVQLMPVYDYGSVKEDVASSSSNRNWGYDPVNYNAPEGSYSTNPYDGNTRITEFKQMIQALHDRGISVVMDVVYNHTFSNDSCFNRTVPGYYYRMHSSSAYSNGSGCGNETASDKLMYRKYMIESVKYWAEEYHIDGFRFDLMGIHDITTMNDIRSALDGLYSDGSGKKILMYGEPWTGGSVAISDGCSQSKAGSLNSRVGMFCDSYRDAIKGSTDGSDKGFVQGNTDKAGTVANGVTGKGFSAQAPSQTIAYADAHDNLILWDKIVKSNGSSSWNSTSSSLRGQVKKVMGLLLTSQGIPFMTAGSEFCRTKQGDTNSYKSSDAINEIDWSRVKTYSDVAAYYKGLLEIRENYSPMKSSTFNTPSFQSTHGDVVAYTYSNNWSNVRCYAYTDGGEEPNGKWNNATVMTSEGNGWLKCTIPAPSSYVMFHTNSQQEPGANETGYLVSGEAWIQNKKLSFSSKVITSHIDAATGEKIADDEILIQSKVSSDDTYKTSPLSGRTDVIAPVNASGNLSSGIINVVYLYTSSERPSTAPSTVTPTTAPVTQPTEKILIGDVNLNGAIDIVDTTAVQKYIVKLITLSDKALIAAARCDADGENDIVSVKDATYIQMYVAKLDGHGNVGTYYESEVTPTTAPVTEPATEKPTVAPTTVPATTAPVTEPTTTPSSTYTVKFTDSLNWGGTLYCYSWAEDGTSTKSWPGVAMTYLNTNDLGQKVYSVEVPNTVDYIIFTNGSSQTIDIGFDGTSLNYYTESQYDSQGHAYVGTW